jgi:hypothetical protein
MISRRFPRFGIFFGFFRFFNDERVFSPRAFPGDSRRIRSG